MMRENWSTIEALFSRAWSAFAGMHLHQQKTAKNREAVCAGKVAPVVDLTFEPVAQ
jgi:hypothetical protein